MSSLGDQVTSLANSGRVPDKICKGQKAHFEHVQIRVFWVEHAVCGRVGYFEQRAYRFSDACGEDLDSPNNLGEGTR